MRAERPRRFGVSAGAGTRKSNGRQPFAAVAAAVGQRGLAALAGIAIKKPVLAFAADFRRLILAFHKFKLVRLGAKLRFYGAGEVSSEPPRVKARLPIWEA